MNIGYARVSTDKQNDVSQIDGLTQYGCLKIFKEKASAKSRERPELDKMLNTLRERDVVIVQRLDRLGRSLKDLIELLDVFKSKNVKFVSLNEGIDTTTAMGELAFHLIGAIAQFERRLISERTKIGLTAARARGRKGGRRVKLKAKDVKMAQAMLLDRSVTKTSVAAHFGVSRPTLDKALQVAPPLQERSLFE